MKKTILLAGIMFFSAQLSLSQPILYGLTEFGGNSAGSIARYDVGSNTLSSAFSFPNDGSTPALQSSPVQVSNGTVYGLTRRGGKFNSGTIYAINEDGSGFRKIHDFDFPQGADPRGSMVLASNSSLYGMTLTGGSNGQGTIYRFDPLTETVTKLHDFVDEPGNREGQRPFGALIERSGRLFGMLSSGGENNIGSLFSIALDGSGFTKHHDFTNVAGQLDGANPYGTLFLASDNLMYGMTNTGGTFNRGIIFSFDPVNFTFTKRFDLGAPAPVNGGANPFGTFIQDPATGQLLGLASAGGASNVGVVFSFNPLTNAYANLHSFRNVSPFFDGRLPSGTLVQTSSGTLIGLAALGGINRGTIFRLQPDGSGFTVMRQLSQADGQAPYGSPLLLRSGLLMATPTQVGDGQNGTILLFTQDGNSFTKVHDFNFEDGGFPRGSLTQGKNGSLYGMTFGGGAFGQGSIFSFQPSNGSINRLFSFRNDGTLIQGSNPNGSLTVTPDGTLFGMTFLGGGQTGGVLFSIGADGTGYTIRHTFDGTSGRFPYGNLVLAPDGLLYGMTTEGGTASLGVIFSFDPATNTFSLRHSFDGTNGASPRGSLLRASNGLFYGLTRTGGANDQGTLFSFNPSGNIYTVLHSFADADGNRNGANPNGSLAEYADGVLYGLTAAGGAFGHGTVFSFNPATGIFTLRASLDDNNQHGRLPLGSLTLASDKLFYGMTNSGGAGNRGTLFSFDPATGILAKRQDFNLDNGASPLYSDLLEPGRCRPPVVRCPDNISVASAAGTCTAAVTFSATTTDYCPDTRIRYYLFFGTPAQTEINSGYTFPIGTHSVSAVASNLVGEQSSCTFTVTVTPGSAEICGNNVDDDCDGWVDETCVPRLRIWDTTAFEASGLARVRVSLSGISENQVSVRFSTKDKSAKSPQDFIERAGQLTFKPGGTTRYIDVVLTRDQVREKSEEFEIVISNLANATLDNAGSSPNKAKITILDGSAPPVTQGRAEDYGIPVDQIKVSVWPNPSPGTFRLRLDGYTATSTRIRVTDLQGRLVEQTQLAAGIPETTLGARWAKGTYFVEVTQGEERSLFRLIKQ
jgi:uncharacterized repeat protein (TIGR03803 family)